MATAPKPVVVAPPTYTRVPSPPVTTDPNKPKPDITVTTIRTTVDGVTTIEHVYDDHLTPAQREALENKLQIEKLVKNPWVWVAAVVALYLLLQR